MDITITQTTENTLLSRQEVKARIAFEGAIPSRKNVRKALAEKVGAKENQIIITKIQATYGETSAHVSAHVFESEDALKKVTSKSMLKRHGLLTEEKKEEKS